MPKEPSTSTDEAGAAKRLRKAIGQIKSLLTRAENYAQEQKEQVLIDLEGIKLRMEELQRGLQAYKDLTLELLLLLDEEATVEDETEDRYFKVMSDLRKLVVQARSTERDGNSQTTQQSRLPRLDIATFDGRQITEYQPFIDIFKAVVDDDRTLTAVQKLFYLKRIYYSERDATRLPSIEELLSFVERRAMSFEESQMSAVQRISSFGSTGPNGVCYQSAIMQDLLKYAQQNVTFGTLTFPVPFH